MLILTPNPATQFALPMDDTPSPTAPPPSKPESRASKKRSYNVVTPDGLSKVEVARNEKFVELISKFTWLSSSDADRIEFIKTHRYHCIVCSKFYSFEGGSGNVSKHAERRG